MLGEGKMKLEITEWAKINNMSIDQFTNEITAVMVSIAGIKLDSEEPTKNSIEVTCEDSQYSYSVVITRTKHD